MEFRAEELQQAWDGVAGDLEDEVGVVGGTATMRYVATHRKTPFKVELFLLSPDPHDQTRFARRQVVDFEGHPVHLPTAEDVVITKLRWSKGGNRAKDVEDVRQVLALKGGKLDLAYVRQWADQHGTRDIFERLFAEAPNP